MKKRILILCTGNSCRSQMAEGFLKEFDKDLEVFSASRFGFSLTLTLISTWGSLLIMS